MSTNKPSIGSAIIKKKKRKGKNTPEFQFSNFENVCAKSSTLNMLKVQRRMH